MNFLLPESDLSKTPDYFPVLRKTPEGYFFDGELVDAEEVGEPIYVHTSFIKQENMDGFTFGVCDYLTSARHLDLLPANSAYFTGKGKGICLYGGLSEIQPLRTSEETIRKARELLQNQGRVPDPTLHIRELRTDLK